MLFSVYNIVYGFCIEQNGMDFMFSSLLEQKKIVEIKTEKRNFKSLSIAFLTIKINAEFEISMRRGTHRANNKSLNCMV